MTLMAAPPATAPSTMVGGRMPLLDAGPFLRGEPGALETLAAQLRFASEKVGFYLLTGHGVPDALIRQTFAQAERFHAQDLDAKLAIRINEHNVGYMPMKGAVSRASQVAANTKPNLNEAFFARRERTADDPDVIANKPLRGLNQWPADLPGFREAALAYMDAMVALGTGLLPVYARALGLVPDYFSTAFSTPNRILRMSHYPPSEQAQDDEFGIAPHTDSGFMTLLAPNAVPGLSVRMTDGTWFDVPHVPGAYVVNTGDMLHRWSNEVFLSTPHRVTPSGTQRRYAIPFFFDPHPDTMIEALPSCVGSERPARHEPILFDDYIVWFARRNYLHQKQPAAA